MVADGIKVELSLFWCKTVPIHEEIEHVHNVSATNLAISEGERVIDGHVVVVVVF